MLQVFAQRSPEAVALTCHHDPNTIFYHHLLKDLYGSPNMYAHTSGCEQDRRSACLTIFGHVFPMHDFANAKYVILWGMNMLGANQGLWESRALLQAKKKGCKLVVVDPNFTETAQKADEWLPVKPGTDAALALAMCHSIIEENLHDAQFCDQYTEGFGGFRDHLRDKGYTPEWAADICGIDADTIKRIARDTPVGTGSLLDDLDFRRRIAKLEMRYRSVTLANMRTLAAAQLGHAPGAESSILKLVGTELYQEITELTMDALGQDVMGWFDSPEEALPAHSRYVASQFNYLRAVTIYGGSNEIQRNVIAKQILGLS